MDVKPCFTFSDTVLLQTLAHYNSQLVEPTLAIDTINASWRRTNLRITVNNYCHICGAVSWVARRPDDETAIEADGGLLLRKSDSSSTCFKLEQLISIRNRINQLLFTKANRQTKYRNKQSMNWTNGQNHNMTIWLHIITHQYSVTRRPCSDSSHVTAPYKLSFYHYHYYYYYYYYYYASAANPPITYT